MSKAPEDPRLDHPWAKEWREREERRLAEARRDRDEKGRLLPGHRQLRPANIMAAARNVVERYKVLEYLGKLVAGDYEDASHRDRREAANELLNRAYGKPVETQVLADATGMLDPTISSDSLETLARALKGSGAAQVVIEATKPLERLPNHAESVALPPADPESK